MIKKRLSQFLMMLLLFFSLSSKAANNCYSSILNCGGAPDTNMQAALSASSALATPEGCYAAVKSLRSTCKIKSPVSAMYFSDGKLKGTSYFVTRKPSHSGESCTLSDVTVKSGSYERFYRAAVVYGDRGKCVYEYRQCIDGYLGGPTYFKYGTCKYSGIK